MRTLLGVILSCFLFVQAIAQVTYKTTTFSIQKINTFKPNRTTPAFSPSLKSIEAPFPGGSSYKSFLQSQKTKQVRQLNNRNSRHVEPLERPTAPLPKVIQGFGLYGQYIPVLDTAYPIKGGTPLDNTMAISNDGFFLASVNSKVYGYDFNADTTSFETFGSANTVTFERFADSLDFDADDFPFDPKLLFDPIHERFIITFLAGRSPSDSRIVVGFSTSSNPAEPWHVYEVPGNPQNVNNWTDYPAFAITEEELFITVNLIEEGVSWQEGFRGSIIWQIPLENGYSGSSSLDATLYDDVRYDGEFIRNLCPVEGGVGPLGPNMYFLSNRNFDLANDSVFIAEVTNTAASGNAQLTVKHLKAELPYGMPPNGRQADTDLSDPTKGFQTNDSRMLGAFLHNNTIQYVANTINFETGLAAVYHGIIDHVDEGAAFLHGRIIGDSIRDFGYPNIAFTGTRDDESEAIIAFNHTSPTDFAGVSCVYYSDCDGYSSPLTLKTGDNYVDNFADGDSYERWGDYFGIQRVFNEPGKVWTTGFYGLADRKSSIWVNELQAPSYDIPAIDLDTAIGALGDACNGKLTIRGVDGWQPYEFFWSGTEMTDTVVNVNLCGEYYEVSLRDSTGCYALKNGQFDVEVSNTRIFPNPFRDRYSVTFTAKREGAHQFMLLDIQGKEVKVWQESIQRVGRNQFSFSPDPLAPGIYTLIIVADNEEILNEKLLKVD